MPCSPVPAPPTKHHVLCLLAHILGRVGRPRAASAKLSGNRDGPLPIGFLALLRFRACAIALVDPWPSTATWLACNCGGVPRPLLAAWLHGHGALWGDGMLWDGIGPASGNLPGFRAEAGYTRKTHIGAGGRVTGAGCMENDRVCLSTCWTSRLDSSLNGSFLELFLLFVLGQRHGEPPGASRTRQTQPESRPKPTTQPKEVIFRYDS